eukprot:CAMPEP_0197523590 /NCGR_PEP_ID=MMETSP1318-20131121/8494_1 /TAXON_ID=552666 /ORGANISM="Partenskyella glossopodia, Strain RCC365" /LENGTH=239 /DNA_ID=CAMNT_0043076327 /DNA_START=224 /DNA_END=943 /DNA_ORIENTATION=+
MAEIESLWVSIDKAFQNMFVDDSEKCTQDDAIEILEDLDLEDYREDWPARFRFADAWGNQDNFLSVEEMLVMVLPDLVPSSRVKWWKDYEFPLIDTNRNELISWTEYKRHLKHYNGYSEALVWETVQEQKDAWMLSDKNRDKHLDNYEFVMFSKMQWIFHHMQLTMDHDQNGDGLISKLEIIENMEYFKHLIHQHSKVLKYSEEEMLGNTNEKTRENQKNNNNKKAATSSSDTRTSDDD